MSDDSTEQKWFSMFRMILTPAVAHAQSLGHTGAVMLYAALDYLSAELKEKTNITDTEVEHAKAIAAEARKKA